MGPDPDSSVHRASLASREDLSREMFETLAEDDQLVATSLAMNARVPRDLLERLSQRFLDLRSWIGLNPRAPVSAKEGLPLRDHSAYSVGIYLDDVGATAQQRSALLAEHARLPPPGGPTLVEAWRAVCSLAEEDAH